MTQTKPFFIVVLTLMLLLATLVGCGDSEDPAVPDIVATATAGDSAKPAPSTSGETIIKRATESPLVPAPSPTAFATDQPPVVVPEVPPVSQPDSSVTPVSTSVTSATPATPTTVPVSSADAVPMATMVPSGTTTISQNASTVIANLSEKSPDVDTEEIARARDMMNSNSPASSCWEQLDDPRARRWCLGIDDVATAKAAAIRGHNLVMSESGNTHPFTINTGAITPPLVGNKERFDVTLRDGYDVFNLRQFNAPVVFQDVPKSVAVPPVFESYSWDKFVELLDQDELISPDEVIIEQWIHELDHLLAEGGDKHFPIDKSLSGYENYFQLRERNPHIDVVLDTAASPFSDDPLRFIVRLSAVQAETRYPKPANIVFVMDSTASMAIDDRSGLAKETLVTMLKIYEDTPGSIRSALISFNDTTETIAKLEEYEDYDNVLGSLARIYPFGNVSPEEAIVNAFAMDTDRLRLQVVLFTDNLTGVTPDSYQALLELVGNEEAKGNSFNVVDLNSSNATSNLALVKLTNVGGGIYHHVRDKKDIDQYTRYRVGMIRNGSLRNVGMNIIYNNEIVESVRVIGHEEAEPLLSTTSPGNYPFEGKRTLMLDVKFRDSFIPGPRPDRPLFAERFNLTGQFGSLETMMNGAVYANRPFGGEKVIYGQNFNASGYLDYNPNLGLIRYIMITGLGELMRQSELACSADSTVSLDSLIEMGELIQECSWCGFYESHALPYIEILQKVKALTEEQNIDLCTR